MLYRPPSSSVDVFDNLYSVLCNVDVSLFSHFILVGDLNVDFMSPSRALFSKLQCIASSFVLSQAVTEPTHYSHTGVPSIIDLAFVHLMSNLVPPSHPCRHLTTWEFSSLIKYHLLTNDHAPPPKGKYGVTLLGPLRKQMRCSIRLTGNT